MACTSTIMNDVFGNEEFAKCEEYDDFDEPCDTYNYDDYTESVIDNQPYHTESTHQKQLAVIDSYSSTSNKSFNTSNKGEIVSKKFDPFILLARYIYSIFGFEELNKFYMSTKSFKRDLDEQLLQYYEYLELGDVEEQTQVINNLLKLICEYNISFNSLIFDNESLMEIIGNYFKDKKKNIHCIDPDKNEGYIVSELQLEWAHRTHLIETYYNEIVAQNNKKVEKCIQKKSYKSIMYQAFNNYMYGTTTPVNQRRAIKNI